MKTVDLKSECLSLEQILAMAGKDSLLLRDAKGEEFLLTPADDFATEVELLRRNHEFLAFLDGRFASRKRKPLDAIETKLVRGKHGAGRKP